MTRLFIADHCRDEFDRSCTSVTPSCLRKWGWYSLNECLGGLAQDGTVTPFLSIPHANSAPGGGYTRPSTNDTTRQASCVCCWATKTSLLPSTSRLSTAVDLTADCSTRKSRHLDPTNGISECATTAARGSYCLYYLDNLHLAPSATGIQSSQRFLPPHMAWDFSDHAGCSANFSVIIVSTFLPPSRKIPSEQDFDQYASKVRKFHIMFGWLGHLVSEPEVSWPGRLELQLTNIFMSW